jgi:uncharacterized protein YndB with AHSA1/START domain
VRLRHINVTAQTPAHAETVYRYLTDGSSWPRWSPIDSFELEQEGEPPPEGVGAIRVFRQGRTTGRDQILELVPGRRLKYASLSGLPVRDYIGQVDLEEASDGSTAIRWQSSFFPRVRGTGWIVERSLKRFLEQCAHGLADHAAAAS